MNGVLSLDDVKSSGNDGSSNDSETSGSDDVDALEAVCDELGANYDHAKAYVEAHGKKDDLVEFAERLRDGDDDLQAVMEEYRRMNDIHRVIINWLRSDSREFTTYTGAFYGDTDDPEPGTYNHIQQRSRANDGNLIFYRALFPTPVRSEWDDTPVCWHEFDSIGFDDDQQDSHIYVTQDFVDEYGDFTIEVEGETKPRPPANSEVGGSAGGNSGDDSDLEPLVDPSEFTNDELADHLPGLVDEGYALGRWTDLLEAEKNGKARKGAKATIRECIDSVEAQSDSDADGEDTSEPSDAAKAGEVHNEGSGNIPPSKIKELMDEGWEKDEIIEFYG